MCRFRESSEFAAGAGTLALWVLIAYWRWLLGGLAAAAVLVAALHHVHHDVNRDLRMARLEQVVGDCQDVRRLALTLDDAGAQISEAGSRLAAFERAERGW